MVKQATAVKATRMEILADFCNFAERCCEIGDYDPFHLELLAVVEKMDIEQALWFSCLFIAHYNIGSAWVMYQAAGAKPLEYERIALPIETNRRALHGGKIFTHLEDLAQRARSAGGLYKYFTAGFRPRDEQYNWEMARHNIGKIYGCGRWAEYTLAEIFQKVHWFKIRPTDMGQRDSSGPRHGLALLMGEATDNAAYALMQLVRNATSLDPGWLDYAVLESLACDFNSLNKGKYYIGRDIDREQYRILKAEQRAGMALPELWDIRSRVFPAKYLGELRGWQGIDKERCKVYQRTGVLIDR